MRENSSKYLLIVLLFVFPLLSTTQAFASSQSTLSGEVEAGSVGNTASILIVNKSKKTVEGVIATTTKVPGAVLNLSISPRKIDSIAPGETGVFDISFAVEKEIKEDINTAIEFYFSTEKGKLESNTAMLNLNILSEEEEKEEDKYVYVLAEVKVSEVGVGEMEHNTNQLGYLIHQKTDYYNLESKTWEPNCTFFKMIRCTSCPDKIIMGEPIRFAFESRHRYDCENYGCNRDEDRKQKGPTLGFDINGDFSFNEFYRARAAGKDMPLPTCEELGIDDDIPELFKPEESGGYGGVVSTKPVPRVGLTREEGVSLQADLQFINASRNRVDQPIFNYSVKYSSNGTLGHASDEGVATIEEDSPVYTPDNSIFVEINRMDLKYVLQVDGKPEPIRTVPFEIPPEFRKPPLDSTPDADNEVATESGKSTTTNKDVRKKKPDSATGKQKTIGGKRGKDKGSKAKEPGLDPDKPESINPKDPKTAAIIKEWISSAEPPMNATHGADARYEPWGRFVGKIIGGVGKVTGNPGDTAGRTPEQYVWDKRDTLDSVDHCTLGEYVMAKLANKSIDHCRGRYKPQVSDVVGMSKEQAEKKLSGMGLKTEISLGNPAPTKKDSLIVEKTDPHGGSTVKRGGTVTIVIHPPFIDRRTVPGFKGSTAQVVIKKIKEAGLIPKINTVKASSVDQTGKVSSLDPPPGSEVVAGATVFVDAFLPFVKAIVVPNVVGLDLRKAADIIKAAGLTPAFELGANTQNPKKDKTIARQVPEPGMEIVSGSEIKLFVYTLKTKRKIIPNLIGMPIAKAQTILQEMRLSMAPELGEDAAKANDAGRVYKQSPESGSEVTEGVAVNVWVYGEYKSTKPVAVAPPTAKKKSDPDNSSATVFILDRVEFHKFQTKTDLCKENMKCRHEKYPGQERYYSISEGEARFQFIEIKGTTKKSDYTARFNFESPPSRITLGEKLHLNSTAVATGYTTGWQYRRSFTYYIKKDGSRTVNYFKKNVAHISNRDLPHDGKKFQGSLTKKSVNEISIPNNIKKELTIGGKFGWDPGLYIEWIYRAAGSAIAEKPIGKKSSGNKVPNVIGLGIRKAANIVKAAGFTPAFELGADTKDPKKDKTISRQIPPPGMKLVSGSEIKMFVHTLKIKSRAIPNLVGMPIGKVQTTLQEMGLSMAAELGEDASRPKDAGRVYKQSPESGSEVTEGVAITVWVYGEKTAKEKPLSLGSAGVAFVEVPTSILSFPLARVHAGDRRRAIPLSQRKSSGETIKIKRSIKNNDFFETKFYNSQERRLDVGYSKKDDPSLSEYSLTFLWKEKGDPFRHDTNMGCTSNLPKGKVNNPGGRSSYYLDSKTSSARIVLSTMVPWNERDPHYEDIAYRLLPKLMSFIEPYAMRCKGH